MFILEAVPDMMMMICLQIFFIWVLQKFGESPVTIISFNENRAYLLPILSLAVLPTLQMFRMMVLYIKEEQGKHYVEVAYGKAFHQVIYYAFIYSKIYLSTSSTI